jgi:hypothetical protein
MSKNKSITVAVAAVLAVVIAGYLWNSGGVPLITLTPANFAEFTQSFDGSTDEPRLVLLLSPT